MKEENANMGSSIDILDLPAFTEALRKKVWLHGLTRRDAAKQIGIGNNTFGRIICETVDYCVIPSIATYVLCCKWLGVSLYKFIKI